jgi:hypothetical protein
MIETLLKFPFSAALSLAQMFSGRARLKLVCGWTSLPNEDGVGNFLAFWIKIINPSRTAIYLERIEANDSRGEIFFPLIRGVMPGQEVPPRNNIVVLIPCGHILSTMPTRITIVDATEVRHTLKGSKLSRAVVALKAESLRWNALGHSVHPNRYRNE